MATKRVYDSKTGLYKVVNSNGASNATVSTNGGGTSLVAGANALSKNNGGGSSYSGSSYVAPTLGNTWDNNTDYQSIINSAVQNNDYATAAKAEQLRNQKITATGSNYPTTNNYSGYLGGSGNSQYTGIGTHNDNTVSEWARKQIDSYKAQYNEAAAKGDKAGMEAAHAAAEAIRERYGYSGGVDGSDYIGLEQDEFEFEEEQPEYNNKYNPQIEALLNEILNRGDFSYDVMNDPLYQQYAKMYQREGDRAMKETLAEAAAGAGGMNTYAITAAQQANSYYNSQLNDKVPELYQLAYEMYLADKESKVQDLGLLQNMDATQYARYRDTMSDWRDDRDFAYGIYRDDVADKQWLTNLDYNDYWANKNFDYNDAWANKNFDYNDEWKNKEWDASQADKDLANNRYDRETAEAQLWEFADKGIMPSDELIAASGLNKADVEKYVSAVKAEMAKKNTSNSTEKKLPDDNGNDDNNDDDKKKIVDEGDGGEEQKDFNNSNLLNSALSLGLGPSISYDYLDKLVKTGRVIIDAEGNVYWANGYNKDNYRNNLSGISLPGFDWGL